MMISADTPQRPDYAFRTSNWYCTEHPERCTHRWIVSVIMIGDKQRCYVARECGRQLAWVSCNDNDMLVSRATHARAEQLRDALNRIYKFAQ